MAEKHFDLILIGFGNVGKAFASLLLEKSALLESQYGFTCRVTGIHTQRHGSAINPDGLDLQQALDLIKAGNSLQAMDTSGFSGSTLEFIAQCPGDVLVENSPLNPQTGRPALDHIRLALQGGRHAITANKGPVVYGYAELMKLAASHKKLFMFESAVMDGAPIFSLFRGKHAPLAGAKLLGFDGILNSCTNLLLELMENGKSFDEAIEIAKSMGLTETDLSFDVDGWDASVKVAALATVLMGLPLNPQDVDRTGIRGINPQMLAEAREAGQRWKLICTADVMEGKLHARVHPELVGQDSPFYSVGGSSSIVRFKLDVLPALGILETDPSPKTTAFGLLHDLIFIAQSGAA
ncbi:MAG TPA: homoserine dehydrogenase [Anaerolineaceae bacterium]|nr:homoserine dehydrogenase [Anaerolineaceae bacterium]